MATKKITKTAETVETAPAEAPAAVEDVVTAETTEAVKTTAVQAKVIKTYRDKNTGAIVQAGTVLTLTAERFAELSPRYVKRW